MIQSSSIASAYSPPFRIVSKYFIAAIVAFVTLNLFLLLSHSNIIGHHFNPKILSITHIATLGWVTMIIFGALFQLIPVVLEVNLFSEVLAEIQFWIFLIGVIGMVYCFWHFNIGMLMNIVGGVDWQNNRHHGSERAARHDESDFGQMCQADFFEFREEL